MYVPWIVSVPLLSHVLHSKIRGNVTRTQWRDVLVPLILVSQLVAFWGVSSNVWTVSASLASYYVADLLFVTQLANRRAAGYTNSILIHHAITIAVIGLVLAFWDDSMTWGTQWVLMSEISTIFLNLRPILRGLQVQEKVHRWNRMAFIGSFILSRLVVAPFIYLYFPYMIPKILYTGLVGLNIYWLGLYAYRRT